MNLMRYLVALLAALLLTAPGAAYAEERILSYVSDVQIRQDGSLSVAETIRVNAEGYRIQRGIYRDFPTRYKDRLGQRVRVGFDVQSVERDGAPEKYALESLSNGVRVRIGDADVNLPYGEHSYTIRYRTTRQLGFFETYDEIYWNVTGNGWDFPIDVAEARIALPSPAAFGERSVYTGPQGSTGKDATVVDEEPGRIVFRSTRPLASFEGLTVAVAWPKGIVTAPAPSTKLGSWFSDNGPLAVGLLGLLGVLLYYFHAWRRAGRGPRAGTIVPLFSPPDDLSPAATRFISEMGFDNRTYAAAIVDLGVRGRIRLVEGEKGFLGLGRAKTTIHRTGDEQGLPAPERAMMQKLLGERSHVVMEQANHAIFGAARTALQTELASAYEGSLFKRNLGWAGFGLLLIAVAVWLPACLVLALYGTSVDNPYAMPVTGLLLVVLSFLLFRAGGRGALRWLGQIAAVLVAILAAFVICSTIVLAIATQEVIPLLIPLLALPLAISAFWWMAAPTREGRAVMDRIAGFRRYLSVTEEERLETLHPPEKTPELFERYLPYAISLEVENEWAARFAAVLAAAAAAGQATTMGWYSGHSDPWNDTNGFVGQVGSSLASTVSSASTAPGSSSGSGGGGSSGGGGGGGGGGGW